MTDLGLNIVDLKRSGRPSKPLAAEIIRPLTEADIEAAMTTERNSKPPELKRITDRHHALARLLAAGTSKSDAALTLNYDPSRVSILQQSPAFQELVALYRSEVDREFATTLSHMSGLSKDALLELRQRIEDEPESLSVRELLAIQVEMHDRVEGKEMDKTLPTRIELVAQEFKEEPKDD